MLIINKEKLTIFFNNQNLDIRETKNGRWIDQKCTPDIVSVVADFILTYLSEEVKDLNSKFTNKDIWHSEKSKEVVKNIFKKPNVSEKSAISEYNKLFAQPIKMFAAAGILKEYYGEGYYGANLYKIVELDILKFISYREINALDFLEVYIKSTLIQSGIYNEFKSFFNIQDSNAYILVKEKFGNFMRKYTNINGTLEPNRIFTKVINPLAFKENSKGTERGRISSQNITYDMLMYNRDNFRDIYHEKPKNMTRQEYMEQEKINYNPNLTEYQIGKAKKVVRTYNDEFRNSYSEHYEESEKNNKAVHIHHIFPKYEFIEIAAYIENLISLTPNQHFLRAHPDGNTFYVDTAYQHLLLLSKMDIISDNVKSNNVIYSMDDFRYVLSIGFKNENFLELDNNKSLIKSAIDYQYV